MERAYTEDRHSFSVSYEVWESTIEEKGKTSSITRIRMKVYPVGKSEPMDEENPEYAVFKTFAHKVLFGKGSITVVFNGRVYRLEEITTNQSRVRVY